MKKLRIYLLFPLMVFILSSCGRNTDLQDKEMDRQVQGSNDEVKKETVMPLSEHRIKISSEKCSATFQLYDTQAADELYGQLPLTLDVENFADAQWMFYPPKKLNVTDAEVYHEGKKGELSYYAPWGDVFMLYEDFHSGDEMHRLGVCLTGMEEIEKMSGEIQVEKTETEEVQHLQEREYLDVVYDTLSESQKLDLFLPEEGEGPFPLVMFIHGGGWFSGDKADGQESAWVKLRKQGYAVASVEYRLSGEAIHPAGIIDCKTALRYLKANAGKYHIDSGHIAVSGDSSGGHYALMLAFTEGNPDFEDLTRGNPEQEAKVNCVVAWYPATDLAETMRTVQEGEYTGYGAEFAWSNIERYVDKKITDVRDDVLAAASPIQYVAKDMPPLLLQHGDADSICPIDQSKRLYRKAVQTAGKKKVRLDVIKGAEHGDSAFENRENMNRVCSFLDEYMK